MKCFYHDDLDGRAAMAIVAKYENNYNPEDYFEVNYVQDLPLDKIEENETVYFVDYSFSTIDKLNKILEKTLNIIWIDHHKSSLELIEQYPFLNHYEGIRKNGISGAGLTWMYFNKKEDLSEAPEWIRLVSDYDTWILSNKKAMHFKLGMDSVPHNKVDDEIWKKIDREPIISTMHLVSDGLSVKKYITQEYKEYLEKYSFETEIYGYKVLACNRRCNSLLFGDKMDEYDIVCPFVFTGEKYVYSLFTNKENIDCSEIAKSFGGGGHQQAAGFSTDELIFGKNLNMYIDEEWDKALEESRMKAIYRF